MVWLLFIKWKIGWEWVEIIGIVKVSRAIRIVAEFGKEARWHAVITRTEREARLSIGENEAFTGTSHADIGEATFFFEIGFVVETAGAWEEAFFHADNEDDGEFEAFGGMHGHESDGMLVGSFVGARHEGGIREKIGERIVFDGIVYEYFEVLHAVFGGGGTVVSEGAKVKIGDDLFDGVARGLIGGGFADEID